jgi:pimeloyl-ACP methyl ester carboxylesterase/DNA-binding CsgD family transcriptional regulator
MISLLEKSQTSTPFSPSQLESENFSDEELLINLIYRFANKKDEWFNLLLSLSNCISLADSLPKDHPYQNISDRLLIHLKNAIKISTKLNTSSKHVQAESVLNHIPMGAAIIDSMGRIIEINQIAENIIETSSEWQNLHGYLQASHLKLVEVLSRKDCLNHESHVITLPLFDLSTLNTSDISVNKKHSKTMPQIHITAIPNSTSHGGDQTKAQYYCCFQTNKIEPVCTHLLKSHYQLTDTEALVVATLVEEISSQKTAHRLKLKEATVRGHLSSIYQKFDVNRKPDLIRKVLLHSLISRPELTAQKISGQISINQVHDQSYAIYLRDGRKLSYIDHQPPASASQELKGSQRNKPETIVLLHNLMGSGFELPPGGETLLTKQNVRFIIPERPGYGDSDPHAQRDHQAWCQDFEELLNTLKIEKVKVIAHSIGGAYALALAEFLPDRIARIAMVNSVTRLEDLDTGQPAPVLVTALLHSLRFAPFLIEPILKMAVGKDIEHFYEQQLSYIRPTQEGRAADINLLNTQRYRNYSILNLKQSAKQGIGIWANELKLSFAKLGFEVKNNTMEYQFWHGEHDDVVSIHAALKLAKCLNTINFNRLTNETHFLFSRHFNQVVEQLISPRIALKSEEISDEMQSINAATSQSIPEVKYKTN